MQFIYGMLFAIAVRFAWDCYAAVQAMRRMQRGYGVKRGAGSP